MVQWWTFDHWGWGCECIWLQMASRWCEKDQHENTNVNHGKTAQTLKLPRSLSPRISCCFLSIDDECCFISRTDSWLACPFNRKDLLQLCLLRYLFWKVQVQFLNLKSHKSSGAGTFSAIFTLWVLYYVDESVTSLTSHFFTVARIFIEFFPARCLFQLLESFLAFCTDMLELQRNR